MRKLTIFLAFLLFAGFQAAAQMQISGTVTGEDGLSIPGVSVVVKNNPTIGTTTDLDGKYNVTVPSDAQVLVFSFVGMATQEIMINGRAIIDVVLSEDVLEMDEVVVVAYGAKRKGAITGAVDVVDQDVVEKSTAASFDQMLQGRATGVQVTATNGIPGASASIRIRGTGSINASTEPLYVVDGVPVDFSNFNLINPNDISSFSVLKDASAAALYGSRAANGVILVTTKTGRKGKSEITYSYQHGYSYMQMGNIEMMNAQQKLQYEMDLGFRSYTQAEVDSLVGQSHDWFETLSRTGTTKSHQLSISGGSDKTNYYFSLGKFDQEGISYGSYIDRMSLRLNVDHQVKDWFKIGNNFTIAQADYGEIRDRRNVQNPFAAMFFYNPYEAEKLPDGEWNRTHQGFSISEALINNPETYSRIRGVGSMFAEVKLYEGLTFKTQTGIDYQERLREAYTKPGSILASYVGDAKTDDYTQTYQYVWTNTLNYRKSFNDVHEINVLAGSEYNKYYQYFLTVSGSGMPSDKLSTLDNAASIDNGGSRKNEWALMSYFGMLSYSFDQKYFFDGSIRRDGSSRFGVNNRYGTFWAIGAGWNLHEEDFLKSLPVISRLQLRASIGTSGNMDIGNYESMGLYSFDSYGGQSAAIQSQIANENISWEKSFAQTYGLDYAFFNHRLRGTLNYYIRNTKDLLLNVPLSRTSGFVSQRQNIGELKNSGIEFNLEGDVLKMNDLTVTLGASISTNQNEVVELYEGQDIISDPTGRTIIREGEPIHSYYMVRYAGVNPANGEALYYDKDGNITNVWNGDDAVLLEETPHPKYYGNFTLGVQYKGFNLSAILYYNYGNYIVNGIMYFTDSDGDNVADNVSTRMLDAWQQPGDITDVPKQSLTNTGHYSTRYLEDASYIRLRDLTLSYTIPTKYTEKVKLSRASLFIKGTNLFTYAPNFSGFDPEVGSPSEESSAGAPFGTFYDFSYPTSRTFTFGVEVSF